MKKGGLFLGSIFIAFVGIELFFRFYFSFLKQDYDIEMWRYATKLKQSVEDLRSHQHKPNTEAMIMGELVKINSKGLRDKEYVFEKPKADYRILVLGDSITFGFGVSAEQRFSDLLSQKINANAKKVEVINTGVGNYNTEQQLAYLKNEGLRYNPDEVLLAFYINDLEKTQKKEDHFLARNFMTYIFLKSFVVNWSYGNQSGQDYESYYKSLYTSANLDRFASLLDELKFLLDSKNIKLKVVMIPELHNLQAHEFKKEYEQITKILQSKSIPVVNTKFDFDDTQVQKYYWVAKDDAHPNSEAHQIIAESIFNNFYK